MDLNESELARKNLSAAETELLSQRIADLQLSIKDSRLEILLNRLYQDLEAAGLKHFKPEAYLSDEWGCPAGVPVIGIAFYLARPELCGLECQLTGIEAETDAEIMMYLRHEAGHAFNYAHKLYKKGEWVKIFGDYGSPYKETYGVVPFSSKFVRHIPGWYAQKHPDDDFAETFAVWLTPGSRWGEVYKGTPALEKLTYVDKAAQNYRQKPIIYKKRVFDAPVQKMTMTLDSWYQTCTHHSHRKIKVNKIIDEDLRRAFPASFGESASSIIESEKLKLIFEINGWTGLERHVLSSLFDDLLTRIAVLELKIEPGRQATGVQTFAILATTLAMNYVNREKFIE
jgi:hypothetical protein